MYKSHRKQMKLLFQTQKQIVLRNPFGSKQWVWGSGNRSWRKRRFWNSSIMTTLQAKLHKLLINSPTQTMARRTSWKTMESSPRVSMSTLSKSKLSMELNYTWRCANLWTNSQSKRKRKRMRKRMENLKFLRNCLKCSTERTTSWNLTCTIASFTRQCTTSCWRTTSFRRTNWTSFRSRRWSRRTWWPCSF